MEAITIQRKRFEEVDLSKYQGVWIVAEIKDENVRKVSFELLGKAIELANELKQEPCVLLIGNNVKRFSQEFSNRGAKKIYIALFGKNKFECIFEWCDKGVKPSIGSVSR